MATTPSPPRTAAGGRLEAVAGLVGLTSVVLVFAVLVGSRQEPDLTAPAGEFLAHYRAPNTVGSDFRSFVLAVALVVFVWFVVVLSMLLRRVEGEVPWRSTVALVSGAVFAALVLPGTEVAAVLRAEDLDPQIARYAFDESQAAFANARVALGSFAACSGWVIISTRYLPRWVGWVAIASGVGLVLTRIGWTNNLWLLPYVVFWLWTLTVALLLLRRGVRPAVQSRQVHP